MSSVIDTESDRKFNLLVNVSNQANLVDTKNVSPVQLNSFFLFVSPYVMEKCIFEDLNIDLKVDESGKIWINNRQVKPVEIKPGVSILGIVVR